MVVARSHQPLPVEIMSLVNCENAEIMGKMRAARESMDTPSIPGHFETVGWWHIKGDADFSGITRGPNPTSIDETGNGPMAVLFPCPLPIPGNARRTWKYIIL